VVASAKAVFENFSSGYSRKKLDAFSFWKNLKKTKSVLEKASKGREDYLQGKQQQDS